MEIQITARHSISDLDPTNWDRLAAGRPFTSRQWLKYCERVLEDEQPLYLVAAKQGEWVGAAVFWLRRRPSIPDVPQWVENLLGAAFRRRPMLICEIPIAGRSGLLLPRDPEMCVRVLNSIRDAAASFASRHRAALTVFGYLDRTLNAPANWPAPYHTVQLFPGTEMDLSGVHTYDDYLAGLDKKKRKNIRRNRDAALAEGVEIEQRDVFDADLAVMLANNVAGRHGGTLQREIRRIYAYADMVDSVWLTGIVKGKIVGFDLLLGDGGAWKVQSTGSDYSTDRLYFLLSDEDIRFAIEKNAFRLIAGTHLYSVKERLGYEVQQDGYVRYTSATWPGRLLSAVLRFRQRPPQ